MYPRIEVLQEPYQMCAKWNCQGWFRGNFMRAACETYTFEHQPSATGQNGQQNLDISLTGPHLIGLQEISIIRGDLPEMGAFEMNYLDILLMTLERYGLKYRVWLEGFEEFIWPSDHGGVVARLRIPKF